MRRLLRSYAGLAGIAATAVEAGPDLAAIYGLRTVAVGSIYPSFEHDLGWRVAADAQTQRRWLLDRIHALRAQRRAVVVLAADRDEARGLAAMLLAAGIDPVRCDLPVAFVGADRTERTAAAGRPGAVSLHCRLDPSPVVVELGTARAGGRRHRLARDDGGCVAP